MILDYIIKFHFEDCLKILSEEENLRFYNIKIDFLKLFETYPDVGDKVLCSPTESLPSCDRDIVKAQQNIIEYHEYKDAVSQLHYCYIKKNVHARFFGLPVCPELHPRIFPKNVDLGCFLKVTGTVVRVTQSKMLEYQRKYVCMKCKYENSFEAQFENRYVIKAPHKCGNAAGKCKSTMFTQVNLVSREHCKDYQEIKIQEQVNKLSIGTIPGSMWVVLEDDLVDCCKPGDDVHICGTVRRRWRPSVQTKKSEVELVFLANYIEVCNSQRTQVIAGAPDIKDCFDEFWSKYKECPLKGRDKILSSVCPQVYGLHSVKLALLLTIITGSNHVDAEGNCNERDANTTRVRGQCHLLLVGDPGTGKSELLRAGAALATRAVLASGAGSSRAGLTCAALREEGEWQLEAGALVLSDGGVCCIDEISHLREHDRTAIHEAMEQQTISIAKAGIVCKLNTRCAVIAACNPKGRYETDQPLSVNVSLGTPLLSRFDLIFILLDSKNRNWDKLVSSFILYGTSNDTTKKKWSLEKLQMYISLVGPKSTQMTKSANVILQSYYMIQRKSVNRDPSRTTVRMLDSLFRLSQAHCRLMYRDVILPVDAIVAVSLTDLSMQDCTLEDTVDALHSTMPKYPDFDYLCTAKKLLNKLNLHHIWKEELLYYAKLLQIDCISLENNIDNKSYNVFAKFDDVTDDNIMLSASLVTSSYFHKNKTGIDNKFSDHENAINDESNDNHVNENLVKTLKKHAALNKVEKNPSITKQISKKRKRKEITVDKKPIKVKAVKKSKSFKGVTAQQSSISESDDDFDNRTMLNAVPSVNDIFTDLGIDFNKTGKDENICTNSNLKIKSEQKSMIIDENSKEISTDFNQDQDQDIPGSSRIRTKLKQFQFIEKHDLNKFNVQIDKNVSVLGNQVDVVKLEEVKTDFKNNSKCSKCSVQSSQLSIFESSDCDEVDLDI